MISELDAAQALLDLHNNVQVFQYDPPTHNVDETKPSTMISEILIITSNPPDHQLPNTSTPISHSESQTENSSPTIVKPYTKTTCEMGTQTDIKYQLPNVRKMATKLKRLNCKIHVLERQLKKESSKKLSAVNLKSGYSDTSSDEVVRKSGIRKANKRKRTSSKTTCNASSSFDTTATVHEKSNDKKRCDPESKISKASSSVKNPLEQKNLNKTGVEMVSIGGGNAVVPARLLKRMDWSSYTNATRKLLTAVFPRIVLATHSLTGKRSPAFPNKPAKKKLDAALVNDIVQTVVERCGVPENVVRTSITTKCADESKMFRSREANKKKQKLLKKENISPSDDSDNSEVSG